MPPRKRGRAATGAAAASPAEVPTPPPPAASLAASPAASHPRTFVVGRHTQPVASTGAAFGDDFAQRILMADPPLPLQTGAQLVAALRARFATVKIFLVGDGIHLPDGDDVDRQLRFVALAAPRAGQDSVLGVIDADVESATSFLQVLAWDASSGVFNFYFRNSGAKVPSEPAGEWLFNGASWDAFSADAAGAGPFDGHVNGSVVMKERAAPWLHWQSQSAGASPGAVRDVTHSLVALGGTATIPTMVLSGAEDLQTALEALMTKWNRARVAALREGRVPAPLAPGALWAALAQLLTTTTIELAASPTQAANNAADVAVPATHLYDSDAFQVLGLQPAPGAPAALHLGRPTYNDAVALFGLRLVGFSREGEPTYTRQGDAHFALAAPVRAFDDVVLLRELLRKPPTPLAPSSPPGSGSSTAGPAASKPLLSLRMLRAALAVDFPNPVYSTVRAALLDFAPDGADGDATAFEAGFVAAVRAAAAAAGGAAGGPATSSTAATTAAAEFVRWYDAGKAGDEAQAAAIGSALAAYMTALAGRLATPAGVNDLFEVLETRRRRFRPTALNEFKLTLPIAVSGQAAGEGRPVFMKADGTAEWRQEEPPLEVGGNALFLTAGGVGGVGGGSDRVLPSALAASAKAGIGDVLSS